jgi:chromate reductase, NAD(P)H dehydrogenase (quinone)
MRILAVCGSLNRQSSNLELLQTAKRVAPPHIEIVVFDGLGQLPLFNPDLEEAPASVVAWRHALNDSQAVLIASPEYGHSLTGALKNGIDWVIGSGELERKIVAITCAVPGADRGLLGLRALATTLGAVNAVILGGAPIVKGPHFDSAVRALVLEVIQSVETRS